MCLLTLSRSAWGVIRGEVWGEEEKKEEKEGGGEEGEGGRGPGQTGSSPQTWPLGFKWLLSL